MFFSPEKFWHYSEIFLKRSVHNSENILHDCCVMGGLPFHVLSERGTGAPNYRVQVVEHVICTIHSLIHEIAVAEHKLSH